MIDDQSAETRPLQIVIYGAGGFAREVAWLAESCRICERPIQVVAFIDDNPGLHGKLLNEISVLGFEEALARFPHAKVVSGIGSPRSRQTAMEKAASAGYGFATLVHPSTEHSRFIEIGAGTVICAGTILTTNISLGKHVQINLDCTIGHDVTMDDYVTLAPGAHVSGWVHFGRRVYVGTGAVIVNGTENEPIVIGDDVVVGAGACVIDSIPEGSTVVGVPAKPIKRA